MDLQQELLALHNKNKEGTPKEIGKIMKENLENLIATGIEDNILKAGEIFPDETLLDIDNKEVLISELLKNGPTIISFYRGGWCPYCNLELQALQTILPEVQALNAQLIAISPETPDNSINTKEKSSLEFSVLSDVGNALAQKLNLTFNLTKEIQELYLGFGIDVEKHNGDTRFELPVPATFVVGTDGIIKHVEASATYTTRPEPKDLLQYLK